MEENKKALLAAKIIENTLRIGKIIEKLKIKFQPAKDEASSIHSLSTKEFINLIVDHDPYVSFEGLDLLKILQDEGYKYEAVEEDGDICFKWLVL